MLSHTHTWAHLHTPYSLMFTSAYCNTMCRHSSAAPIHGVVYSNRWHVCICSKHVYPIFNALLSHCWFAHKLLQPTKWYLFVSDAVFAVLIKTIYRSENFNPMVLNVFAAPSNLSIHPIPPYHSLPWSSRPICLNFIRYICNLIQIWCHIRKNKQTNTPKTYLQLNLSKWDIYLYIYTPNMKKEFVTRKHWFGFSDAWHGDELNAESIISYVWI